MSYWEITIPKKKKVAPELTDERLEKIKEIVGEG